MIFTDTMTKKHTIIIRNGTPIFLLLPRSLSDFKAMQWFQHLKVVVPMLPEITRYNVPVNGGTASVNKLNYDMAIKYKKKFPGLSLAEYITWTGEFTGVKKCTFKWLISNGIAQKGMVFNSLIIWSFDYDCMHQLWNDVYYISTILVLVWQIYFHSWCR